MPVTSPLAPKTAVGTVTRAAATHTARVATRAQKSERWVPGPAAMTTTQHRANTQHRDEEDAGVDVEDGGCQDHFAEGTSEGPVEVQCRLGCLEGESECQPQVCQS